MLGYLLTKRFRQVRELLWGVVEVSVQSLPYLFCAISGFIPFFEEIGERGEIEIVDKFHYFYFSRPQRELPCRFFRFGLVLVIPISGKYRDS